MRIEKSFHKCNPLVIACFLTVCTLLDCARAENRQLAPRKIISLECAVYSWKQTSYKDGTKEERILPLDKSSRVYIYPNGEVSVIPTRYLQSFLVSDQDVPKTAKTGKTAFNEEEIIHQWSVRKKTTSGLTIDAFGQFTIDRQTLSVDGFSTTWIKAQGKARPSSLIYNEVAGVCQKIPDRKNEI